MDGLLMVSPLEVVPQDILNLDEQSAFLLGLAMNAAPQGL